jgi:hypothetical protein
VGWVCGGRTGDGESVILPIISLFVSRCDGPKETSPSTGEEYDSGMADAWMRRSVKWAPKANRSTGDGGCGAKHHYEYPAGEL